MSCKTGALIVGVVLGTAVGGGAQTLQVGTAVPNVTPAVVLDFQPKPIAQRALATPSGLRVALPAAALPAPAAPAAAGSREPGATLLAVRRPAPAGVVDAGFVLLHTLSWAAMVADYEITLSKLATGRYYEANFLYGRDPSRARLYAIGVPLNAASTYLSYRLKKKGGSSWMALPMLSVGMHGFAVTWNLTR